MRHLVDAYWMKAAIVWLFVQTTTGGIKMGFTALFFVVVALGVFECGLEARRIRDERRSNSNNTDN